jgi:hypothetical protein
MHIDFEIHHVVKPDPDPHQGQSWILIRILKSLIAIRIKSKAESGSV